MSEHGEREYTKSSDISEPGSPVEEREWRPSSPSSQPYSLSCIFNLNRNFLILIMVSACMGPSYAIAIRDISLVAFAYYMSLSVCASFLIFILGRNSLSFGTYTRLLLILLLSLCMPAFFAGAGPVVSQNNFSIYDEDLLLWDTFFLGRLFPHGQLALALDQSTLLGPNSFIGKFLTEILQLFYVSYYIWGYSLLGMLMIDYLVVARIRDKNKKSASRGTRSSNSHKLNEKWTRLKMFICAWLGAYILNFMLNLLVPARSPRVYIADMYTIDLDGFGLAGLLRRSIYSASQGSFGAFPSGHVALSWVTALMAKKLWNNISWISPVLTKLHSQGCFFSAIMITLATLFLRYHYFMDVVCAFPLIVFGLFYGGFWPNSHWEGLKLRRGIVERRAPDVEVGVEKTN
eukprot:TRINITY_DN713_c0_g1_i2.p1 TRINITY_DN713_c0_g1~~TRINITY_DN713_c0_g1_i2.p1  ORF type:complete len:403 (+),score=35.26 TRINITY_DN713_c0_g1_i2:56-1264(+)